MKSSIENLYIYFFLFQSKLWTWELMIDSVHTKKVAAYFTHSSCIESRSSIHLKKNTESIHNKIYSQTHIYDEIFCQQTFVYKSLGYSNEIRTNICFQFCIVTKLFLFFSYFNMTICRLYNIYSKWYKKKEYANVCMTSENYFGHTKYAFWHDELCIQKAKHNAYPIQCTAVPSHIWRKNQRYKKNYIYILISISIEQYCCVRLSITFYHHFRNNKGIEGLIKPKSFNLKKKKTSYLAVVHFR